MKRLRTTIRYWAVLVPLLLGAYAQAQVPKGIDKIIRKAARQSDVTGMAAAVVTPEGHYFYGYGHLSKAKDKDVDSLTGFQIGSITKTFTTLLLQRAVDKGLIDLNDPVNQWLPDSAKMNGEHADSMRIWHLTTHTSGLPPADQAYLMRRQFEVEDRMAFLKDPFQDYNQHNLLDFLDEYEPQAGMGRQWVYSNLGYAVLGFILEQVYDKPYRELLQGVLDELDMHQTTTTHHDYDSTQLAKSYNAANALTPAFTFKAFAPAGSVVSNLTDMAIYAEACMGINHDTAFSKVVERSYQPLHPINPAQKLMIGMAWMSQRTQAFEEDDDSVTVVFHNGHTAGHSAELLLLPEQQIGVVLFANRYMPSGRIANDILKAVLDHHAKLRQKGE